MRFHLPSLPHTQTTRAYDWCAYTAKVRRFADMMTARGHTVFVYSGTDNEAACAEHVCVVSEYDQHRWFGETAFDLQDGPWETQREWWTKTNVVTAGEIARRAEPGDFLCCIVGTSQQPLAAMVPTLVPVEYGIGYYGTFAQYRAFESCAHRAYVHGKDGKTLGRFFDTVIPNSYDPADYLFTPDAVEAYLLYMGRITEGKGLQITKEVAALTGRKLVVAGAGNLDLVKPQKGLDLEVVGVKTGAEKAELIAHAWATLVPSLYLEPFGGIAVESMISGVPAITTDWGAFPETVVNAITGFRCNRIADFVAATEAAGSLDRFRVRQITVERFSTVVIAERYEEWFRRIEQVRTGEGFYADLGAALKLTRYADKRVMVKRGDAEGGLQVVEVVEPNRAARRTKPKKAAVKPKKAAAKRKPTAERKAVKRG